MPLIFGIGLLYEMSVGAAVVTGLLCGGIVFLITGGFVLLDKRARTGSGTESA